jgi:hypothetical protein
MAPVLKVLEFLRMIWIGRDYIKRFPGRGVSLLAFLGRKLNTWCRFWLGNFGPGERRFIETEASSYSVSAVAGEYVVAASSVPVSTSLHEHTESQLAQTVHDHPRTVLPIHYTPLVEEASTIGSGNLSTVSVQSSASDRYSIITNLRELTRAPLGQPSQLRRATYPQFGCGPVLSRSRERTTWPPTPTTRPRTHPQRLEIITAQTSTHGDGKVSPVVQPLASSSDTHEPPSPPPMNEIRTRQSSTSVDMDVPYPPTGSLPISSSNHLPQTTDRPFSIDYSTIQSSPVSPAVDLHGEPLPSSPTSSNHPTLDLNWPEGRFVQLINSDQIPRYEKNATMQVRYAMLSLHTYISLQTPRGDSL